MHLSEKRQPLLNRVRRIAGQLEAVERALLEEADCATTLQRVAAVRGAVNGLLDEIVADHLQEHVARPGLSDAERAAGAGELIAVIRRYSN
ncbi:metal/formaldehyde-sensitive transcriptional repressor [Teichococcus vastitatis]|jgi:DNA-binding FrmR family transcriptional regulator|uniref:Metal/formaldehyde-sensitive transcriptional repressor n=1 Tax=Teichococcus vastitatis TaxID=2307076 RepID=A0ABS9WCG2_9PROT|nr:metal/formaldehyde-sensitive transcriptional repressor [Pseudoroseomonas vastitatis]MCI0756580.1 metal/formaldehyde-sensitive transcriptional repressor [Pseudoroseomonas vastitatis]